MSADADATVDAADANDSAVPDANRGVIVVGGTVADDAGASYVVTALDPTTGLELPEARQPMLVSAVLYDGTRDLWYVFESGGANFYPLPDDPFYLHVRTLDPVTGEWVDLSRTLVPAGVSFLTTAVFGERVSYVAYGQGADAGPVTDSGLPSIPSAFGLVTLDTSDPEFVTVSSVVDLPTAPTGLLGTSSTVNSVGGYATECTTVPAAGVAELTPVEITGSGPPSQLTSLEGTAKTGSLVGFGSGVVNGTQDLIVVTRPFGAPLPAAQPPATVQLFDPVQGLQGTGTFPFLDGNVRSPAFSACLQTLFVVGANTDLAVHAVAVGPALLPGPDGGAAELPAATPVSTGHSGQGVYFEPYTSTVLAPFSQGDNAVITALTASLTADGTPQLALRPQSSWSPPAGLRPNFIATRNPSNFVCP
jgi:hypothetical protein